MTSNNKKPNDYLSQFRSTIQYAQTRQNTVQTGITQINIQNLTRKVEKGLLTRPVTDGKDFSE